jgi:hypothetical protein
MTLVSVIGNFFSSVAPVFYHFFDEIDTHIIIADDSKRDSHHARKFEKGLIDFCHQNKKHLKNIFITINEDSNNAINAAADYILKHSNGEIYVNISDGLATIHSLFTQKLLPKGVKFISYDIFDNEFHILSQNGIEQRVKAKNMNIKDHFTLKGVEVLSMNDLDFARKNERYIKEIFENYHREYRKFKYCITAGGKRPSMYSYPNIYRCLTSMNKSFDSDFQFLTGGLFEYYVYLQIKDYDFDDLAVGVRVCDEEVENEYDVLAIKDNHLNIIECKHKRRTFDAESVLYKYAALKRMVDYDSKVVIASLDNYVKNSYKRRAKMYDIKFVSMNKNMGKEIYEFLRS